MLSKASLIQVMGFGAIIAYVGLNMTKNSGTANEGSSAYVEKSASHNLAFSGVNVGLTNLYQDTLWRGPVSQNVSMNGSVGSFTVTVEETPPGLLLRSVSSVPSAQGTIRDTVEISLGDSEENSFSLFAWMTNDEGPVYWYSGDTVWGALHSNSSINVYGSPVFMGKVTTGGDIKGDKRYARFKKGYKTGAARIKFPTDLSRLVTAGKSNGKYYNDPIGVTLLGGSSADEDGRAVVRSLSGTGINDTIRLSASGFNGVIGGAKKVTVKGTLDGKLTLFSQEDIWIEDDVMYENWLNKPGNNDLLGLVSEWNIIIANNSANKSLVNIQASIFCRNGSFMAEDYATRPTGVVTVLGSLVQTVRGPMGTFSGPIHKSGLLKHYSYDKRLANNQFRPPSYPGFYDLRRKIAGWWTSAGG